MRKPGSKYAKRRRNPPGSAPGTITIDPEATAPRLHAIRFSPEGITETETPDIAPPPAGSILWLNVEGLGDRTTLDRIAQAFSLHPLAMEDVVNLHQRPKAEDYDDHHFIVLRMPHPNAMGLVTEQVSLFLTDNAVITFQERAGDVFDPVRARLRNAKSSIRTRGADYLTYALIDAVIDAYFPVLDLFAERLEMLEDAVVAGAKDTQISTIHDLKQDLMAVRRAVWPMRDMLSTILRDSDDRFSEPTRLFLRDVHDHTFQLIDMIETYRDIASGLVDIFLSSQANRMNEVMKVLTLIATIFIPLTFIVGVYGMNFTDMPELHWRWGYPAVMGAMAVIAAALVVWFHRKGWLGSRR